MARIDSQILFMITSPRTPSKMIPEIDLLVRNYEGNEWNNSTQTSFMNDLKQEQCFNGKGFNDPAFSARDRINRAPKSLGFIKLSPKIELTSAGEMLLYSKRTDEVFLRQLLKFQVPSPYHIPSKKATKFCVKPYLELLRLVRNLGTLKFDELLIFGMQLTDWHKFDIIVKKIEDFRIAKLNYKGNYRKFKTDFIRNELTLIYQSRISLGKTKTRESNDKSLDKFLETQSSNMRDYADACFRYLRATGLINVSNVGKSLSIIPERIEDVDYILETIDRDPCFVDDENKYIQYLGNSTLPKLFTDNKSQIISKIKKEFSTYSLNNNLSVHELKDIYSELLATRKENAITKQVIDIKDYKLYDDIQENYKQILNNNVFDAPLMLEWNTWRAMTMLDGGKIKANLNFDDFGNPLSTANGNMSDIICDYGDFILNVEVTMSSGQKQYDMEGEPVSRHLGKTKKLYNKPCYCLFIAPKINEACVAYFYMLHKVNITFYGGKSIIIPLPLDFFQKMLEDSYKVSYIPNPTHVRNFFEYSNSIIPLCINEKDWFEKIKEKAINWLR